MTKSNRAGQNLAKAIHDEARRIMLRNLGRPLEEQLEKLYEADAEKLKDVLRRTFRLSGFPARRVEQIISEVFAASREARVAVVRKAVFDAIKNAQGLDKKTFDALFGDEEAPPLPGGRPVLRRIGTPLPRRASESEDESP